jgi:RND superfamily putative drug exporter
MLLRHPRSVLAITGLVIVALTVLGANVEGKLSPTSLDISGTPSSRANKMLREHFGPTALFAILLRGPKDAVDQQGPDLVRALRASSPAVTTLSPWDQGSVGKLRPGPRRALVIVDFHDDIAEAVNDTVPELNEILERQIKPPVNAVQSGFPTLSRALQDESIAASERGELIALPVLLIVLMLVFRTPIAALIPLVFGAITVLISRGLLTIITSWFSIDAFALTVCTMMGLALGVDYALLMVSRFREELATGVEPLEAAIKTRRTAGRTTIFAGSTLMISMLVAFFIVPGALLTSLAATLIMVVALSVSVATIAGPAVLTLFGHKINRWRVGPAVTDGSRSRLMTMVRTALRRPALAAVLIGGIVLVLVSPAVALKTGPPSQAQLSPNNQARKDADLINREIAPGFDAPFVIVASTDNGTITEPDRLAALSRWQDRIAARPGIQVVIGPEQVSRSVAPLREAGSTLLLPKGGPAETLGKLGHNLDRAANGVGQLRGGIAEASDGAGLLAEGSDGAEEGALKIAAGLGKATTGSERAVEALHEFAAGSRKLAGGQHQARNGGLALHSGLNSLGPNLRANGLRISRKVQKSINEDAHVTLPQLESSTQTANTQLKSALQSLEGMTTGQSDPNYGPTLDAVRQAAATTAGLATELSALHNGLLATAEEAREVSFWWTTAVTELRKLTELSEELSDGLAKLEGGGRKLAHGSAQLASASTGLEEGLVKLGAGTVKLAGGISQLGDGASALEVGLGEAFHRSYPLQTGLNRASVRVTSNADQLEGQSRRLRHNSPGIFDSGYFVLSALDGASPPLRRRAGQAVDLEGGGQAATLLAFSRYTFNSPGSIALNKKLEEDASALGREANLSTGVAGGAAQLNDYSRVTRERIPYVIAAITLATFLIMVLILRALPLAAIAVGLNLATVGVAFGVLTLLFNVPPDWPLGGQSYVEVVGAMMIFAVVFGLSIDYAVFLLVRMRERHEVDGDNAAAIEFGLEKTARVITGAAAIMMAVFIAFAAAPIANVSQLGTGLTIAVLLDATVVRIVLLPALMLLLGDRVWWIPRRLERILPHLDV